MTTTKNSLRKMSVKTRDGFGWSMEIDTTTDHESPIALIARRASISSEIKINFNGKKMTAYMSGYSIAAFVNAVYDVIA